MISSCTVALLTLGIAVAPDRVAALGMDGKWFIYDWTKVAVIAASSSDTEGRCWARELLLKRSSLPMAEHLDETCSDDQISRIGNADPIMQACNVKFLR